MKPFYHGRGRKVPFQPEDEIYQTEQVLRGVRFNSGKTPITMILEARKALEGCSRVMQYGAQKYARSNWRRGLPITGVADSLSRHLIAFLSGESTDPETGLPHVDHILCNAIFLSENYHGRPDLDDRPIVDGVVKDALTVVPTDKDPLTDQKIGPHGH